MERAVEHGCFNKSRYLYGIALNLALTSMRGLNDDGKVKMVRGKDQQVSQHQRMCMERAQMTLQRMSVKEVIHSV
jgi:hypothetical protein